MGSFYIQSEVNTYLTVDTGNAQAIIWDETTQTGDTPDIVEYDDGISLTYIQIYEHLIIQPDGTNFFGYVSADWAGTRALGSVQLDLVFEEADEFTEIMRFTDTNTVSTEAMTLSIPELVSLPPTSKVRALLTHNGTPTTFTYTAEIELGWPAPRKWWAGVVGWGPDAFVAPPE